MAAFNRDAAAVEGRLLTINRAATQLERASEASFLGFGGAFGRAAQTVVTGGTLIAGAAALAGGAAIKMAADFEQSLALTQALTQATSGQMVELRDKITDLSRHGVLGMDDLAKATTELARSGVPLTDVMGGALEAVEQLTVASGGELGLEKAAKLTATAMNAFGLSVDEVRRVTAAATVVAQNSSLTFSDFGTGVQYAGATFKAAGFSIEDLAVAMALLGKNGITGSVAATTLRGVVQRLVNPSKQAAQVMKEYGISLFDSAGNAVGFDKVMEQLRNAFSDQAVATGKLTEQQRLHAISVLGLQRTGAGLLILANTTTDALQELRDSFDRLSIIDIISTLMNTLNSQVDIAKNNIVALAIAFGSEFLPPLTEATKGVVAFLQSIKLETVRGWADAIISVGQAAIGLGQSFVAGFKDIIDQLGLTDAAMQLVKNTAIALAGVFITGVVLAVGKAAAGFLIFTATLGAVSTVLAAVLDGVGKLARGVADFASSFGGIGTTVGSGLQAAGDALQAVSAIMTGDFSRGIALGRQSFEEFTTAIQRDGGQVLEDFGQKLDEIGQQWAPWAAEAGPAGTVVSNALTGVHQVAQALQFLLQGNFAAAAQTAADALGSFGKAAQPVVDFINEKVQAAFNWWINEGWPGVQTAASAAGTFIAEQVVPKLGDISTAILQTVKGALDWWTNEGWPNATKAADLTKQFIEDQLIPKLKEIKTTIDTDTVPALQRFAEAAGPFLQSKGQQAVQFLSDLGDRLAKAAANANDATRPFDSLGHTVDNLGTGVGLFARGLGNLLGPLAGVAGAFKDTATQGLTLEEIIKRTAAFFITTVVAAFGVVAKAAEIASGVFVIVGTVFESLTEIFVSDVTTIGQVLGVLGGAIIGGLRDVIVSDVATITGAFGSFVEFISGAIPAVGEAFNQLGTTVHDAVNTILTTVSDTFSQILTTIQTTSASILADTSTTLASVLAAWASWGATLIANIAGLAGEAYAAAVGIATNIVNGVVNGLAAGLGSVVTAARNLVQSAFTAAQQALQSHSPSRIFADLGETVPEGFAEGVETGQPDAELAGTDLAAGTSDAVTSEMADSEPDISLAGTSAGLALSDSLINAMDSAKRPVRETAAGLVDEALNVLVSITDRANQLAVDMEAAMTRIGEETGRKINEAIKEAAKQIERTIQDTQDRIDELVSSLGQSRSDRARRDALKDDQDQRRNKRKQDEEDSDLSKKRSQEDADSQKKLQKDLSDAEFQLTQDLNNAKTDADRARAQQKYNDKVADIQREFQLDMSDAAARRAQEDKDRLEERARQQADADFERSLAKETQDLNDKLEDEALARSIARAEEDRDARIKAINDALTEKQAKIREDADREIQLLRNTTEKKIQILEKEFAQKAADILRKGGEQMRPLVDNIQNILSGNFAAMRAAADDFTRQVEAAINALKRLEQARAAASFKPPNLPSPVSNLATAGADLDTSSQIGAPSPELPMFARGGLVPGPYGKPMVAVVHGGEYIVSLSQSAALMARSLSQMQPSGGGNSYTYSVEANYANSQSPASVSADIRALVQLAKA